MWKREDKDRMVSSTRELTRKVYKKCTRGDVANG